jgi:hypothetical protein
LNFGGFGKPSWTQVGIKTLLKMDAKNGVILASIFDRFWFPFGVHLGAMLGHDGSLEARKRPSRRPKRPSSRSQEVLKEVL